MEWASFNAWYMATAAIEILILACLLYLILRFLQGTPSAQVLTGLVVTLLFLFGVTRLLHLDILNWLLSKISVYLAIALIVIFQPEIRRALAEVGRPHVFRSAAPKRNVVDAIVQAVSFLAERRIGALIAVEREIGTRAIQESGTRLDSGVSWGVLASLFFPHTPLHDGGVIIREDRIVAAGCLFPLSQRSGLSRSIGMRHRAAIGLAEETDAVVVVVSEETGTVSVALRGRLSQDVEIERLRRFLSKVLAQAPGRKDGWERLRERLESTAEGAPPSEPLGPRREPDGR